MTDFGKYIFQFVKDTDRVQTHLSFNKGKYNVPDDHFDEFYSTYFQALKSGEQLYLIEKVHNCNFRFFLDLELPKKQPGASSLTDDDIKKVVEIFQATFEKVLDGPVDSTFVVSKRQDKYHVNFPHVVVNSTVAKFLCSEASKDMTEHQLPSCIDTSVYRTGLRLLGSCKGHSYKRDDVYKVYDLYNAAYVDFSDAAFTLDMFLQTIVRVPEATPTIRVKEHLRQVIKDRSPAKNANVRGISNTKVVDEVRKLLEYVKLTNEAVSGFNMDIERIYATQNKMGMFCYYVSIKERMCPFKCREHQRPTRPIYIEIGMNNMYVKCYDEDCLRRRFPEAGIKLPPDFEATYPELFLSMSTKYWKSEVVIDDETKRCLEESLTGSHFQIAKAAFSIFKDRFRVDDVRNTTWHEFDGVRWNKSHLMNLLISEELPKYYKGIKISDTSVRSNDLKEFLANDEKIDANMRNQLVDNIISKLENVTFKNNILNQLAYMFKTFDPDFYTKLDSNPYLLGFKNGVYDFERNEFRASTQQDYLTFSTGYDFLDYDDTMPQVQEIYDFLAKIVPNTKVREFMLKVLGKSLLGIPDEKFYIWTGISGANGKSTLVNFLEHTLGDYTTSVDVSLLTNRRSNSSNASPDIIRLRGKRIFTFQEPEHDDKLRTGILKQYTGGDTIVARELFKAPVTFKLQGTMLMCCNDLPSVSSIDGGTWRRIRVIEFKSRFCDNPMKENEFKIDPSIKYKIKEWRPYFMSILIHWYNKYLYEGMQDPDEVKKATAKYKVDNDKFNEFFDQCLEEASTFESNKTIYNNFQSWWSSNYPMARLPEIKEVRRAMKIKFGNEIENVVCGAMQYGFNVKFKVRYDDSDATNMEDDV